MSKGFEKILDECLERLIQGESVEECLARYPEQAAELEPLLRVALMAKEASSVEPRPELKAEARHRFQSAVSDMGRQRQRRGFALRWRWRWAMAIAVVLLLFVAGGSTVAASNDSLPGDLLYPVKTRVEQVRMWFATTDTGKAKLHAQFANRRIEEIIRIIEKDKPDKVPGLVERLVDHLDKIEQLVGAEPGVTVPTEGGAKVKRFLVNNVAPNMLSLQDLELEKPALRPDLERARQAYDNALQAINRGGGRGQ
jgi:hypothetical protein